MEKKELCKHTLGETFSYWKIKLKKTRNQTKQRKAFKDENVFKTYRSTHVKKKMFVIVPFNKMKINVALNFPAGC